MIGYLIVSGVMLVGGMLLGHRFGAGFWIPVVRFSVDL